jgi:hypothetical protein
LLLEAVLVIGVPAAAAVPPTPVDTAVLEAPATLNLTDAVAEEAAVVAQIADVVDVVEVV